MFAHGTLAVISVLLQSHLDGLARLCIRMIGQGVQRAFQEGFWCVLWARIKVGINTGLNTDISGINVVIRDENHTGLK